MVGECDAIGCFHRYLALIGRDSPEHAGEITWMGMWLVALQLLLTLFDNEDDFSHEIVPDGFPPFHEHGNAEMCCSALLIF